MFLKHLPTERADRMLRYPIHQEAAGTLVQLIGLLRRCRSAEDHFVVDQNILAKLFAVQGRQAGCGVDAFDPTVAKAHADAAVALFFRKLKQIAARMRPQVT